MSAGELDDELRLRRASAATRWRKLKAQIKLGVGLDLVPPIVVTFFWFIPCKYIAKQTKSALI